MRRVPSAGQRSRESGLALPAALWLAAMVAVLGVAAAMLARTDGRLVEAEIERLQAVEIADGAARLAALMLVEGDPLYEAALANGDVLKVELLGGSARVALSAERDRLDLNAANLGELRSFFVELGRSEEQAAIFAARVADYRDADDLRSLGGAEVDDYRAAGRPDGPRNGPFRDPTEIALVLGIDAATAEAAAARATIWGQGALLIERAENVDEAFAAASGDAESSARALVVAASAPVAEGEGGRVYRIRSEAAGPDGARAAVEIVVLAIRSAAPPFRLLSRVVD